MKCGQGRLLLNQPVQQAQSSKRSAHSLASAATCANHAQTVWTLRALRQLLSTVHSLMQARHPAVSHLHQWVEAFGPRLLRLLLQRRCGLCKEAALGDDT